jgi:hypothetical protein
MLARFLLALVLLLPLPAAAQAPAAAPAPVVRESSFAARMLAGSWALKVEGAVVFRFDLALDGDRWRGTWVKPRSFTTDGAVFSELGGPPIEQQSQAGRAMGEWIELTFGDARPGAVPDVFRFRLIGFDRVEMIYTDTGQAPFVLESVDPGTAPGPWDAARAYRRAGVQPGELVRYNTAPRSAPGIAPRPDLDERPPAVIGR